MKVLFINPAAERYTRNIACPLGLLSIATYLKANGHTVKIADRTVRVTPIVKEFSDFEPDIIGVSVYSMKSFTDAISVSKAARLKKIPVVWGGAFSTLSPQLILNEGCVDYVSMGEGEQTWLELLEALSSGTPVHDVAGLAYLNNGETVITAQRDFLDLSVLPPLDFSFIDIEPYLTAMYGCKKVFCLYISKGCIGNCAFCYNKAFHRCTYRRRPIEHFLTEVKYLVENHGVDCIYLADELWCKNSAEMHEQCDAFLASGINFKWGVQTRVGIFDADDFKYMKKAGCLWVDFGIESGSPEMLKRIHKGIPYDKIEETFRSCADAGIISLANFIIGFPGETREQLSETVSLAQKIQSTQCTFFFFIPGPGSELYDELVESKKYTPPKNLAGYAKSKLFFSPNPNFSAVPANELKAVRAYFLWKGFSRKYFSEESNLYSIAKKDILDILNQLKGHSFRFCLSLLFVSAYEFLGIFINAHFHPFILKRYGLK